MSVNRPTTERGWRFELTRWSWFKRMVQNRAFQFVVIAPFLLGFVLAIMTGLIGTPVGSRNFSIIFVWIVWWALLIVFMVPFGARIWCTVCPIPAPGEWLSHLALIGKGKEKPLSVVAHGWPKRFKNIWLQNASFLGVALFSAIILTRPLATALVLLAFIGVAIALSLKFGKRVFCRYVCPVGGFIGLYSMVAPVEIRVKDPKVCLSHKEKECIRGSENGYGCPWMEYPGTMGRNTYCGMCTECLKTCTKDNVAVNLRPFGTDLWVTKGRGLDEAYKAFIMTTCALVYSTVMLGPWAQLKDMANIHSLPEFGAYAVLFLSANLLILPGLFLGVVWLAQKLAKMGTNDKLVVPVIAAQSGAPTLKKLWIDVAYAFVPLGLIGWIAFSLSFIFVNGSYAIPLLSDPFGWGWNLLGTVDFHWTPIFPDMIKFLQAPLLLGGLVLSILTAHRILRQYFSESQAFRGLIPVAVFLTGITTVFMLLYL